jgi:Tol biopolymer transport system component
MRLATFVSALAVLAAAPGLSLAQAPAQPPPQDGPSRVFQGRDIFGLRTASDPQVRPDGSAIAYVRTTQEIMIDNGRPAIWLVDLATGSQSPLVVDDNANMSPRWSPDGSRLAYVVAGPGGAQLYVRWMASGRSAKVATLAHAPNSIAWSPDGGQIAFLMLVDDQGKPLAQPMAKPEGARWAEPLKQIDRVTYRADGAGYLKPGYHHLFVVSADGGQPRQLTFG